MVEKKEGATQTCKCGTELICVKVISEWQGKKSEKLQWQNSDGSAHYNYNGHEYTCNIPNEIEQKPKVSQPDEFLNQKQEEIKNQTESKPKFTDQQLTAIHDQIDTLLIIEKIVTARLQGMSAESPNPAKVGMYMKFLWDKLENQK
ncbi:MAG: hypothetical protein IIC67_05325 [Thaumarchaeota archaeon]|nr:hypothetical protein [Nitrososphaerota archaeon]